jgi:glyoxylase-like metal-dependent hydrolase (beta-lactamase superfamily II)/ferredoxin
VASVKKRLPGNAAGDFYVDSTCIDCDQCRQIAPATFRAKDEHSVVFRQPVTSGEARQAEKAMVTCPTGSIGAREKRDLSEAIASYPERIHGSVHFCGFASEDTYGGSSYLIVRPQGTVLVDSPRFARHLVRRIEEMGGVRFMFLTHVDDVGDHAKFRSHFGCDRVMHADDARFPVERRIEGREATRLDDDLLVIPTPGHTKGHQVLLYAGRMLFTGDHLAWAPDIRSLAASRDVCWYSWTEQTRSMEKLLAYGFEWVLPGHGHGHRCSSEEMHGHLERCVRSMKGERSRSTSAIS